MGERKSQSLHNPQAKAPEAGTKTSLLLLPFPALLPHTHTSFETLEKQPEVTSLYQTQESWEVQQNGPLLKY